MNEARIWDAFPILTTERLVLRELREEDAEAANRLFASPEVMRYIGHFPHKSIEETREWLAKNRLSFPERQGFRWAITLRGRDQLIGSCGHWRLMKEHNRAEIGYDLTPDCWGQGLMYEALRAILHFGFVEMELHSTEAQIDPDNQRSRRVLERLGFREDGRIRENFYFDGKYTDTVIFTLLRRDFLQLPSDGSRSQRLA